MDIHKNARLTPIRRDEMARSVIDGLGSKAQTARVCGVSARIVSRWTTRLLAEGVAGMRGHGDDVRVKSGPALAGNGATAVRHAIAGAISTLPGRLRQSLTWDQGAEMAQHTHNCGSTQVFGWTSVSRKPLAPRHDRKHERALAPILPEGHRPCGRAGVAARALTVGPLAMRW